MQPIEAEVVEMVTSGRVWNLEDIGGIARLAGAARSVGRTPMMPELLHPLLKAWSDAKPADQDTYKRVLFDLLEVATTDFVLVETVDTLERHRPLPDDGEERCFMLFLSKAATGDHSLSGLSRGAALDGAFRFAGENRRWQLRFLDFVLGIELDDDAEFLRRATKIVGIAFSHWRDKELLEVLHKLAHLEAASSEAAFELGMGALAEAMDRADNSTAIAAFREAKDCFEKSEGVSANHPEARLYVDGLDLLLSFHSGAASVSLSALSARVQQHAFELHAWSGDSGPSWLGARQTEAACWSAFASAVAGVAGSLEEPSWWEPAIVIEKGLLSVYSAGRSLLRRNQNGGVEAMVRPRIRASLVAKTGQAHQVRVWLRQNADHEWASEAEELVAEIDTFIERSSGQKNPYEAASERTSLAALVSGSKIPGEKKDALSAVIANAFSLQVDNMTSAEVNVIEVCRKSARSHTDYSANAHGERLFDTVLLWLVRFVFNRLELTKGNDPSGAYLFERDDGSLPHEDELKHDFFRWVATYAAGSDLEPSNIASGRADIRLRSGPERVIVEVKREEKDCSFEALFQWYAAQATDYQNVSIRLGVLLVLDLATPNRDGTPHLTSLFESRPIIRHGESQPRLILIVKVPGRRRRPSDLTKIAKARRPYKEDTP